MDTNQQTISCPSEAKLDVQGFVVPWTLVPLGLLWFLAGWGLADHWRLNPQYQYGWFVPAFAAYAAWERWKRRPDPGKPILGSFSISCGLGLLLLPAWIFLQPNLAWPLANWVFVALTAVLTLGIIGSVGGGPWVRHFSIPVILMFTAVPWPDLIESPVMQFLQRTAASAATVGLDLLGITAIQQGNVLEVAGGSVGVEEGCSGIRSLQGSLTASLILGEFFRFNIPRRLTLVALSIVAAFVTNILRVGFLAWNAAHGGTASVDQWHDQAGAISLFVCIGLIWFVASRLDSGSGRRSISASIPSAHPLPRWFVPSAVAWIAITVASAELWYYDPSPRPARPWELKLPATNEPLPIPTNVWVQLRYDSVVAATWKDEHRTWSLYFFDWDFGPMFSRVSAQGHRPDICLPATGLKLEEDRGKLVFPVQGTSLPFHAYTFTHGDKLIFVYHGVWPFRSEQGERRGPLAEGKHAASLQSVLRHERRLGQQSAELIVSGYSNATQADAAFSKLIADLLRHTPSSSSSR